MPKFAIKTLQNKKYDIDAEESSTVRCLGVIVACGAFVPRRSSPALTVLFRSRARFIQVLDLKTRIQKEFDLGEVSEQKLMYALLLTLTLPARDRPPLAAFAWCP